MINEEKEVQVDVKAINAAKKEILLTVEAERTQKAYNKYLSKAAKDISIQGFRPGKAPIQMVERAYGEKIKDYFYKDFIDEVFTEAAKEHDFHYLLQPEIKEINWQPGSEMTIKVELETEPEVSFKQVEGLTVPYKPLELNDEVDLYIEELRKENATVVDVETEIVENDEVEFEVKCLLDNQEAVQNYTTHVNAQHEPELTAAALGKKIGDSFTIKLPHEYIHHIYKDHAHSKHEGEVEASFMVNSVRRTRLPELDDEFAKDLEFASVKEMKKKISSELEEKNRLKNQNIKINALITKLYIDNRFDLPENTIQYIAERELDQYKITDAQWRKYYELQIRYQIMQDFINMYMMKELRKQYPLEVTDEVIEKYIEHEAILSDQKVEEWKEKHKKTLEDENFRETVLNYMILNKIAETCTFEIAKDEPAEASADKTEEKPKKKTPRKPKETSESKSEE
jgi:trigger factor